MRRLPVVCAVAVFIFAAFAVARKNPSVAAAAQSSAPAGASANASASAPSASGIVSASKVTVVADGVAVRALAAGPGGLYLTNAGAPNRIFVLSLAPVATPSASARFAAVAGTGAAGSLGDGGAALAAQFNLDTASLDARSGIAAAPDGAVFVADTGNATIREIAAPGGSEPGVIRGIAGRWAAPQNGTLAGPMGISLDRAGDLFIADRSGAIDELHASTSQFETLAHVALPASVAAAPNGGVVYVASPDAGAVFAIHPQTREIASVPGFSPAAASSGAVAASACASPVNGNSAASAAPAQACPSGLATDGAGNLFIADANSGRIVRVDAQTNAGTAVASGLSQPGAMAFDAAGNLYVAEQGANRIVAFAQMGATASNISIAPATAVFANTPAGGSTATQPFTLTNASASMITGIVIPSATSPADFTVENKSCTVALAASSSCVINIAFTPTATGVRSGPLTVTDSNPSDSATASFSGTADDYQIQLAGGQLSQLNVEAGAAVTFNLQVVPDSVFSGTVNIVCPTNLPVNTTCTAAPAAVNVTAGQAAPFTLAFQTTGVINPLAAVPPRGRSGPFDAPLFPALALAAILAALVSVLALAGAARVRRFVPALAFLAIAAAALAGCHKKNTIASLGATPAGTYNFTVTGTSQNAARSLQISLVVVQQ